MRASTYARRTFSLQDDGSVQSHKSAKLGSMTPEDLFVTPTTIPERLQGVMGFLDAKGVSGCPADSSLVDVIDAGRADLSEALSAEVGPEPFTPEMQRALLSTLQERFEEKSASRLQNWSPPYQGHPSEVDSNILWPDIKIALEADLEAAATPHDSALWTLHNMEETDGEPELIFADAGRLLFLDCAHESPKGRRNVVYNAEAAAGLLHSNATKPFRGNAKDMAASWGAELLDKGVISLLYRLRLMPKFRRYVETYIRTTPIYDWLGGYPGEVWNPSMGLAGHRQSPRDVCTGNLDPKTTSPHVGFRCARWVERPVAQTEATDS